MPYVLIETYWNVKREGGIHMTNEEYSINRNILECKGWRRARLGKRAGVLIETYWNVKSNPGWWLQRHPAVLIETYWNVKLKTKW